MPAAVGVASGSCSIPGVLIELQVCADTMIGSQMVRGISGGQKKRVTSGRALQQ